MTANLGAHLLQNAPQRVGVTSPDCGLFCNVRLRKILVGTHHFSLYTLLVRNTTLFIPCSCCQRRTLCNGKTFVGVNNTCVVIVQYCSAQKRALLLLRLGRHYVYLRHVTPPPPPFRICKTHRNTMNTHGVMSRYIHTAVPRSSTYTYY